MGRKSNPHSYPVSAPVTRSKASILKQVSQRYQHALIIAGACYTRGLYETGHAPRFVRDELPRETIGLQARYLGSAAEQARGVITSWLSIMQARIRDLITSGGFDDEDEVIPDPFWEPPVTGTKGAKREPARWLTATSPFEPHANAPRLTVRHLLYKINSLQAWFIPAPVGLEEYWYLTRRLFKHVKKTSAHEPDLSKVRVMILDSNVTKVELARVDPVTGDSTVYPYWVSIMGLTRGERVLVPVSRNQYLDDQLTNNPSEHLLNCVQVKFTRRGVPLINLITDRDAAPARSVTSEDEVLAGDWGMNILIALSNGEEHGLWLMNWLKARDDELTKLEASLRKSGVKPSSSKRWCRLNQRIRDCVRNEVNRVWNRILELHPDLSEVIVEHLDFRGRGLSKRLNRLLTRCGRRAVRAKLKSIQLDHGVTVTEVNPAYSSQECSACGAVVSQSRVTRDSFKCACCGRTMQADVNAARNLKDGRAIRSSGVKRSNLLTLLRMGHDESRHGGMGCPALMNAGHSAAPPRTSKPEPGARPRLSGHGR